MSFYKQKYYEAIDLIVSCIEERFDQPGYKIYNSLESLLMKHASKKNWNLSLILSAKHTKMILMQLYCIHNFKHLEFTFNSKQKPT